MNLLKFGLLFSAVISMTACAHKTPVTDGETAKFCNFKRYELNLDHRNGATPMDPTMDSLSEMLSTGFSLESDKPMPKDDMLFLSGGSLNGAFGAGVLAGWSETRGCPAVSLENDEIEPGCLPEFSVVTGVSTGAILSLAAFTNIPEAAIDGYTIESESEAIEAFVRRNEKGDITLSSYITAVRKGALADITPLQNSIYQSAAKYDLFPAIAKRAMGNRKLLTGVVDVDTGTAVALDMTAMARKIYEFDTELVLKDYPTIEDLKKEKPIIAHHVDCFTRAIAASSSVPLAARPIAIDNRLYIDGGARFLLFSDVLGPLIAPDVAFNTARARQKSEAVNIYMLINGDQMITPKCRKKDCTDVLKSKNYWALRGAREDWNLLELIERTVDVLQTQVGEFSESEIRFRTLELILEREGIRLDDLLVAGVNILLSPSFQEKLKQEPLSFTQDTDEDVLAKIFSLLATELEINPSVTSFTRREKSQIAEVIRNSFENYHLNTTKITSKTLKHEYKGQTCTQWREHDEITDRNLQFHVNYMKCMIEAGRDTMKTDGWQ